ncbi:hypothetical protein [Paracoccus marinaquae]|uniref:Uncharacterized protein n=1 Tax=Paracoccus marinaquae TaxID=2841926 RepID=A0ABS6AGL9_9RHOB|nr:hypothetical protein [Paracoccus marinaquae]MBU3029728.1 hypothetical protein [Paracoccus marinaquae]
MTKYLAIAIFTGSLVIMSTLTNAQETEDSSESSAIDPVVLQLLLESLADNIEGNISAAERESGELAKLVRALTGISVLDIERFGICGGPNSELRKILGDSACGGKAE